MIILLNSVSFVLTFQKCGNEGVYVVISVFVLLLHNLVCNVTVVIIKNKATEVIFYKIIYVIFHVVIEPTVLEVFITVIPMRIVKGVLPAEKFTLIKLTFDYEG